MATIGYTPQSFVIDGKRMWLVSAAIHYPRIARDLWRDRIRAAREAGFNTIETYVFWNAHETEPGVFDFDGQNDLRAFVETIAEEGMWCILRPGPFVCAEWDAGGLPPWLLRSDAGEKGGYVRLREGDPNFLKACSRYLAAVMGQVRDLQVTEPTRRDFTEGRPAFARPAMGFDGGGGGPIVLMQAENEWMSENPEQEEVYLRQIVRYLRENGCKVPLVSCNQLYQRVDGTIHTWNGSDRLGANLRQLKAVQPGMPRLVTEYWPGWFDHWGGKHADTVDAVKHEYRLGEILAAGAMFNVFMFHGGTNFAFFGGRTVTTPDCFMTTSYDYDAPLREGGGRGQKYRATKRVATFADHFGHLMAHLEPDVPACLSPGGGQQGVSVAHLRGGQGEVIFLMRARPTKHEQVELLLPDGLSLPVALGDDAVAWVVRGVNLAGVATLDLTNLRPWALLDKKLLVLFGPAGSEGLVSLDGTAHTVTVPKGQTPAVFEHDELRVAVLNREQVDAAYLGPRGLVVGCDGFDEAGEPKPLAGWKTMRTLATSGEVASVKATPTRKPPAPKLGEWTRAGCDALLDGSADAFREIDGPASLEDLGVPFGYGWYRLSLTQAPGKGVYSFGRGGDRLHVYDDAKLAALVGGAPGGAADPFTATLGKDLVVLCDQLGRFNFGQRVGEPIGVIDHLMAVKPLPLPKPAVAASRSPDPFELAGYVLGKHRGETAAAEAVTWKVKPAGRKPILIELGGPLQGVLDVNGVPRAMHHAQPSGHRTRVLLDPRDDEHFTGGTNELTYRLYQPLDKGVSLKQHVALYQATAMCSEKAKWAFAPWSMPADEAFAPMPKQTPARPAWCRASFRVTRADTPLFLEPNGMSKGQVYLNGHNVGRYFVATATGAAVPPQKRYYLPEPWLNVGGDNELTLFDEHGKSPAKCRLVYDPMGPYGGK